jgi:glyceraldehyde-3-phosphate dehydrogenase (NADP+)
MVPPCIYRVTLHQSFLNSNKLLIIFTGEQSNFGQQVSIFGKEPATIAKMIDHLVNQVSRVNINCQCQRGPDRFPFTGRKDSAEGTLSVSDALRVFSIRALVAAKENDVNKTIINSILRERTSNFLSTDFII